MSPFFLFVLFVPLLATTLTDCNEHSTCLYLHACYDESELEANSTRMKPTVKVTMRPTEVVQWKKACNGFGFISTLSIVSNSASSVDISFETDLERAGFMFRSSDNSAQMTFNDSKFNHTCGKDEMHTMQSSSPLESLGRVVHRMRVTNPDKKPLDGLFNSALTFLLGGTPAHSGPVDIFWKHVRENRACDGDIIHDSCNHRDDCDKIIIGSHSLQCSHPDMLQYNNSNKWSAIASVSCDIGGLWKLVFSNANELIVRSPSIDLLCAKLPSNVTVAPSPDEETEEIENETDTTPSIDESEEALNGTVDVAPNAQHAGNSLIAATEASVHNKIKDERLSLPGSKWIWIGCGATLLTLITVGNISVCFYCYRNKNDTARKQSKVTKSNKKKGGKLQTDSASSGKQSSTERGNKPLKSDLEKQPTISSEQPTEMLLDRLKTERIN